jgi:hypothetical protein
MTTQPNAAEIQRFFALLYPAVEDGWLLLSQPDPDPAHTNPKTGKRWLLSSWLDLAQTPIPRVAQIAATMSTQDTVYFGVVLQQPSCQPDAYHRSTNAGAYVVPGLWVDLDLAYGQHAASALPQTDTEALDFLHGLPAIPSLIVHSGGGMYGYWLFKEPYIITTEAEREQIADLSRRFNRTLNAAGKLRGWDLDTLGDLARVLRPAGSVNFKYARPVDLLHEGGERYNPHDFDWLLPHEEPVHATHGGAGIAGQPDLVTIAAHYGTSLERKSTTELAGPHPQHGSSTGDNFNVHSTKGVWHCWRHGTGGDALALIAVCEALVPCEDMRTGALRGDLFKRAVTIANEAFHAGIQFDTAQRRNGSAPEPERVTPMPHARLTTLTNVQVRPVEWLWEPYLAKGTIAMMDGDPGLGKSWLAIQLAACLSKGYPLPDQCGRPTLPTGGPQHVILITAEDSPEHTIKPRLMQADGDPDLVHILNGWTDPSAKDPTELQAFTLEHVPILEDALRQYPAALVVIDPLQAYLGKLDMHRSNETRPLMAKLAELARAHDTVILCIRHPSKPGAGGGRAIHRGLGSIDFIGIARTGLNLLPHPVDPTKGLLAQGKNNLGPLGRTLIFSKAEGHFTWAGVSRLGADFLAAAGPGPEPHALYEACFWLEQRLEDGRAWPAEEIIEEASAADIGKKPLYGAKKALGVVSQQTRGGWMWRLSPLSLPLSLPTPLSGVCGDTGGSGGSGVSDCVSEEAPHGVADALIPPDTPLDPHTPDTPVVLARAREDTRDCDPLCPQCHKPACQPYAETGRVCMQCGYCERPTTTQERRPWPPM